MTVHDLRRRWKPHKLRLQSRRKDHPTTIRFHRACSWLARVEQMDRQADADLVLTCQWIAFNSLYGQWDQRKGDPRPDRDCWREFLDRILALDAGQRVAGMLVEHRSLVLEILDDAYLARFFWKSPSPSRAGRTLRQRHEAVRWYQQGSWALVLERLIEPIYLLRCQLIHGAATFGGSLNRRSLARCITMMDHLLKAVLEVWIEHGADVDWGPMCYPPQH